MSLNSDRKGFRKTWLATAVTAALAVSANGLAMANDEGQEEVPAFLQMDDGGKADAAPATEAKAPEPVSKEATPAPTEPVADSTGENGANPEADQGDKLAAVESGEQSSKESREAEAEPATEAQPNAAPNEAAPATSEAEFVMVGDERIPADAAQQIGITDDMPEELKKQLLAEAMAGDEMPTGDLAEMGDNPFDMTSSERMVLEERAQILRDTALWEAKAARAAAKAKYQKANKEVLEAQGLSGGATDPVIAEQNEAIAKLNAKLQEEQRKRGLRLLSVFGDKGDLAAEIFYNGGKVRVSKGDRVGDIKIVKIEPTRLITYQDGERGEINLSAPGK